MDKARLTIDLDRDLHARLRIVAARHRTTMRSYSLERRLAEEPSEYLSAGESPVLAELWDNSEDAIYDEP